MEKAWMVCLGFEPGTAGWKAQTNPLSYGGPTTLPLFWFVLLFARHVVGGRETHIKWLNESEFSSG